MKNSQNKTSQTQSNVDKQNNSTATENRNCK